MLHNGYWDYTTNNYSSFMDKIVKENGGNVWCSIMGLPAWMNKKEWENKKPSRE